MASLAQRELKQDPGTNHFHLALSLCALILIVPEILLVGHFQSCVIRPPLRGCKRFGFAGRLAKPALSEGRQYLWLASSASTHYPQLPAAPNKDHVLQTIPAISSLGAQEEDRRLPEPERFSIEAKSGSVSAYSAPVVQQAEPAPIAQRSQRRYVKLHAPGHRGASSCQALCLSGPKFPR